MNSSANHLFRRVLSHPLMIILRDPEAVTDFDSDQWRRAFSAAYLARMMGVVSDNCRGISVPAKVARWLAGTDIQMAHNARSFTLELEDLIQIFHDADIPAIALKGGAYNALDLPLSQVRISTDIDLMVRKEQLTDAETVLSDAGWTEKVDGVSELDRRYFREWLHELPPKLNANNTCVLDLHHMILPRTDRACFDPEIMWESTVKSEKNILIPCHQDLILHSATHLFRNGQFFHGIRDLYDMKNLFLAFQDEPRFWDTLVHRAKITGLLRPLAFAERYVSILFNLDFPVSFTNHLKHALPAWVGFFDRLVATAVLPELTDRYDYKRELSMWLLSHQPLPRTRMLIAPIFWAKRFQRPQEVSSA